MASPMAFAGAVFQGETLDAAFKASDGLELSPTPRCDAGLDWGWNFTALEVAEELEDGRLVWRHEEVFQKVELNERCWKIAEICKRFNIQTIYADAAGATENATLGKVLDQAGTPTYVQPVPFGVWKLAGIMTRNFYLEQAREVITPECRQLLIDSKAYHYSSTPGQEEKPAKGNDHTVDAATALYAARSYELGDEQLREAI